VFQINVAKVDQNVACVAMVVHVSVFGPGRALSR
jgi:hypothetical protein